MLSEKTWRPESVLRLLAGLFLSLALGSMMHDWVRSELPIANEKFLSFVIGAIFFQGAGLGLIALFLRENQLDWASAFGVRRPALHVVLIPILVAFAMLPTALVLANISAWLLGHLDQAPVEQMAVQALRSADSLLAQLCFGAVAVFLAPLVEEILFRGILYPTVKRHAGRALALWFTALLFAASHVNLVTFIPLTFLALVLTWLYEATDNLLAPILTHCVFNGANYILILWAAWTNSN